LLVISNCTRGAARVVERATGVPAPAAMSVESYAVRAVVSSAPDCSFVDLTLWISGPCAEAAHDDDFDRPKRPIG
jgi:hypothetical protein